MRWASLDGNGLEFVQRLLAGHYDLSGITVRAAARGFVAETFVIEHPSGQYFAKIVPVSRYSAHFEESLPVLAALARAGITQIPQVFLTVRGGYSVRSEDRILALFSHIAGKWTPEYDFERYVNLIATIHCRTQDVVAKPKRDTFALPCAASLIKGVKAVLLRSPLDEYERRLKKIVGGLAGELEQDVERVQEWGDRLRVCRDIEFVITHGDGPGNVVKDESGEIYLIDWDDVLLAPRERDTWFHLRDSGAQDNNAYHGDGPAFLGYYRRICPGYKVNYVALSFYVCLRYLDDLDGFISRIMEPGQALAEKKKHLALLEKDCLGWLRPWMRRVQLEL